MQRASETIGTIATALAKAQAELVNPEKTLSASIRVPNAPNGERTFRYAPLSSGLDIIRKCLGKHEIAVVQSTAFDQGTRLVKLTTVLAHSSGEWVSSEWPVCLLVDISSPQRMGAALTYARRYALFTMVGIAGEDDLDAPDGGAAPAALSSAPLGQSSPALNKLQKPKEAAGAKEPVELSQLLSELGKISTQTALTDWARRSLPQKNKLNVQDAQALENAFQIKWLQVPEQEGAGTGGPPDPTSQPAIEPQVEAKKEQLPASVAAGRSKKSKKTERIDKSVLAIPTVKRQRNKDHLRLVAQQPCLICARQPCDAHHLRFAQGRGLSLKVSDEFTVPLCRIHHRDVHRHVVEREWWRARGIDPLEIAHHLWRRSLDNGQASQVGSAGGG